MWEDSKKDLKVYQVREVDTFNRVMVQQKIGKFSEIKIIRIW